MHEVFPVLAGVAIALFAYRFVAARLRPVVMAVLGVSAAVGAAAISGEAAVSAGFVALDLAQVALAIVLTSVVIARFQARSARVR